ncbi:hypothetical protein CHARACLAT_009936 [Characodon lateralis]|uniref:Uncharacterized protein n=1 Tax=Characodon lateralis TaxID=208331 RepID=A0ABU7F242_9TELE|nr:hypothetical protein [Characodon lateralis]
MNAENIMSLIGHFRLRIREVFPWDPTGGGVKARGGEETGRRLKGRWWWWGGGGWSSAEEQEGSMTGVLKSEVSEGDWLKRHEDLMLIGWRGDTWRSHWMEKVVRVSLSV